MSGVRPPLALVVLSLLAVFQSAGQAALDQLPVNALPYSLSYTVTGNYVVSSVDLTPEPDNQDGDPGYQTATIHIGTSTARAVPQNAEILAAFLYWETLAQNATTLDVQFRGLPASLVRVQSQEISGVFAPCWSQSGNTLYMMRADVLALLPLQKDENGFPTGRRLVNDMDLVAAGMTAGHKIRLPEAGTGNQTPQSAGASLFLVYRDPSEPLRRIVVYDGLHVAQRGETTVQRIRGFLQSNVTAPGQAKLTQIVSRGAANPTEQLTFDGAGIPSNSFAGSLSPDSDRAWASPTIDVSAQMPGTVEDYTNTADNEAEYGEQATMTFRYTDMTTYGCHTWAAIAFSAPVKDNDGDGLIDLLEEPPTGPGVNVFRDPNGAEYPRLWQMGARANQKDLFVEINSMYAAPGTSYGSATHPFPLASQNPINGQVTDALGHDHRPTPQVLQLLGDALARAGVVAHFDVGNPASYKTPAGSAYDSTVADAYIIGAGGASGGDPLLARGGESLLERTCVADPASPQFDPLCQFPAYPGTVSWKYQFQLLRDQLLDAGTGLRRFDPIRNHIFHYLLFAHARGTAQSVFPCRDAANQPVGFPLNDPTNPTGIVGCTQGGLTDNPDFHVPRGVSGVSDLPGLSSMVTLGMSKNFIGTEFFQASTALHELGHSLELWHGGATPSFAPASKPGAPRGSVHVDIAPNCKPNYQSSMSYLHQLNGLIDETGAPNLDYSNTRLGIAGDVLDETTQLGNSPLVTSGLSPRRYRVAWYAPILDAAGGQPANIARLLGVPAATRHCDGTPLLTDASGHVIEQPAGRLETASTAPSTIDWAGDDAFSNPVPSDLDVNFDGRKDGASATPGTPALAGVDDVHSLRLNQLGGSQLDGGFSTGIAYVGTGLTVDGFPYLGGPQYIGGIPVGGSGAFPTGGIQYPQGGGLYLGGVAVGGSGIGLGGSGIPIGASGIPLGGSGIPIGASGDVIGDSGLTFGVGGSGYPIVDGFVGINGIGIGGSGLVVGGSGLVVGGSGLVVGGSGLAVGGSGLVVGGSGLVVGGSGNEITHSDIEATGHAPANQVTVCVLGDTGVANKCAGNPPAAPFRDRNLMQWSSANLDSPDGFRGFRVTGSDVADDRGASAKEIDAPANASSLVDTEELPHGLEFTYWMKVKFGAALSQPSLPTITVTAVNLAPTASADGPYVLDPATMPAVLQGNVFANDTDVDGVFSGGVLDKSKWAAILVNAAGAPVSAPAGLTFNSNGTFSYTTSRGSITFYYKIDPGKWTDGVTDISPDSNVASVTISIVDRVPPTITNLTVNPTTIWSPNGKAVPVTISGTATDTGGSGVGSIVIDVEDEYNAAENRVNNPHDVDYEIAVQGDGPFSTTISLVASRTGNDKDGRKYTIYVGAKDKSGNIGWAVNTLTVTAHDQSK